MSDICQSTRKIGGELIRCTRSGHGHVLHSAYLLCDGDNRQTASLNWDDRPSYISNHSLRGMQDERRERKNGAHQ